jgi:hypothetical protein
MGQSGTPDCQGGNALHRIPLAYLKIGDLPVQPFVPTGTYVDFCKWSIILGMTSGSISSTYLEEWVGNKEIHIFATIIGQDC